MKYQRAWKSLPFLRKYLVDQGDLWSRTVAPKDHQKPKLWASLETDLVALRMFLRDTAGFILRVENLGYPRKRCMDDSILLELVIANIDFTMEVWDQDMPKEVELPLTATPGPSSQHYGIEPSNYDTVSYLNNEMQQRMHDESERRRRNKG